MMVTTVSGKVVVIGNQSKPLADATTEKFCIQHRNILQMAHFVEKKFTVGAGG
jgi:hypothetical protein